jgi:hypothetical protein
MSKRFVIMSFKARSYSYEPIEALPEDPDLEFRLIHEGSNFLVSAQNAKGHCFTISLDTFRAISNAIDQEEVEVLTEERVTSP